MALANFLIGTRLVQSLCFYHAESGNPPMEKLRKAMLETYPPVKLCSPGPVAFHSLKVPARAELYQAIWRWLNGLQDGPAPT